MIVVFVRLKIANNGLLVLLILSCWYVVNQGAAEEENRGEKKRGGRLPALGRPSQRAACPAFALAVVPSR